MSSSEDTIIKKKVISALKEVYDPEIPVNIYDLGLIYEVKVEKGNVYIKMGVTSPTCPLASMIALIARDVVKEKVPEAREVNVEVTLTPPWDPTKVTPEGRERLKQIFGYDIIGEYIKKRSKNAT